MPKTEFRQFFSEAQFRLNRPKEEGVIETIHTHSTRKHGTHIRVVVD